MITSRDRLATWLRTGDLPAPHDESDALALVACARVEGLAPLLHDAVRVDPRVWPTCAQERLRRFHLGNVTLAARQEAAAAAVAAELCRRGIRTLGLKGTEVAARLYDDTAQRPMVDVDLWVLDRFEEARATLFDAGWRLLDADDHAVAFQDPRTTAVVELHRNVVSDAAAFTLDAETVWSRSRSVTSTRRSLSTEDLLVLLALHAAFQHGLHMTLVQYLDFRRCFERESVDATRLANVAGAAGARTALLGSLHACEAHVGSFVPMSVWSALGARADVCPPWVRRALSRLGRAHDAFGLAAVRWHVTLGRRREWLGSALRPRGATETQGATAWGALRRGVQLLRRHALSAWGSR